MGDSVVVVGAGIAGLTTAAYLARAGLDVAVYEQHRLPGGYVSSFERHGFVFPAGPTSFGSNGVVFPILRELGLDGQCHFVRGAHQISWGEHDVPLRDPEQVSRDLPLERFYAVGHYVFNPGGVPTAMITAWYIAREILKQEEAHSMEQIGPSSVLEG